MIHAQARQLLIAFTVASGLAWRGLQKRSLTSAGHVRMRADGVCAPVFSVGFVCSGPASDALRVWLQTGAVAAFLVGLLSFASSTRSGVLLIAFYQSGSRCAISFSFLTVSL